MTLAPPVPNAFASLADVPIPPQVQRDPITLGIWNSLAPTWIERRWLSRLTLRSFEALVFAKAEVEHRRNDPEQVVVGYGGHRYDVRSIDTNMLQEQADQLEEDLTTI